MANDLKGNQPDVIQFGTFTLSGQLFGVDILQMQEIIRPIDITKVPRAPDIMEGVINLRGQVIPVISLRRRFRMPTREFDKETRIINMQINNMIIGFIVDSIDHVRRCPASALEEPPAVTSSVDTEYVSGVIKDEDGLVVILDMEKLVDNLPLEEFAQPVGA